MTSENNCLIPGSGYLTWTYLIDLDNEVFTVNGIVHFSLHTIPHRTWPQYLDYSRSYGDRYWDYARCSLVLPNTPMEYIGNVSRWSKPDFDSAKVAHEYASLSALETAPAEWGVPSWNSLSVSQKLSATLIQSVLLDHSVIFSNPDVAGARRSVNLCCWQLFSAAAPSLLHCPPTANAQLEESGILIDKKKPRWRGLSKPHSLQANTHLWPDGERDDYYKKAKANKEDTWDHIYWTLRGCLVGFCPRLDGPDFVKSEVLLAVDALKRSPSSKSVAILCSGRHVVAISLQEGTVRHTPALLVHDKTLVMQSGALLMIHLLEASTGNKNFENLVESQIEGAGLTSGILSADVFCEVIHFADYDTYQQLSMVCRYARSVYLSHPRINESILIRAIHGGFFVRDRITGYEHTAYMRRTGWEMHKQLHSTFHVRQLGFAAADQIKDDMAILRSDRIFPHFTASRQTKELDHIVNVRILTIWGRWAMEKGVASNESAALMPERLSHH